MLLNVSAQSGDSDEARKAAEQALNLAPGELGESVERWMGQLEQSKAERARILEAAPDYPDQLAYAAAALVQDGTPAPALELCGLALDLQPDNAKALNVLGVALRALGRAGEAEIAYRRAVTAHPGFVDAWCNLANALVVLGRKDEGRAAYDEALKLQPSFEPALNARGQLNMMSARYEEAARDFEALLKAAPDHPSALCDLLAARRHNCDWREHERLLAQLTSDWRAGRRRMTPFGSLILLSNPADQRAWAERHMRELPKPAPAPAAGAAARAAGKVRLGYLSPDFRDHAVALLSADVFEEHDRARFEVLAFSCGPRSDDAVRRRLSRAFDEFVDLDNASVEDIAAAMAARGLDIAIDMGGHTKNGMPQALATRVAPAQVSYLGYPATLGAQFIDYIIADDTLIPPRLAQHYTEKIVRMPHSYQPNSRRPEARATRRSEHGLPEEAPVLCCFNAAAKISPADFASWMRILRSAKDAVLWLQAGGAAARNLRESARAADVSPDRLVFAGLLPWDEHLARLALADLVLDTSPYGAHTTASDALWAGVPVVTTPGETFASRVAASLLNAAGAPELIAPDRESYEAVAIALASSPAQRAALRAKLNATRKSAPLFDVAAYTRALEHGYQTMHARARTGAAPHDIDVPAL